MLEWAGVNFGEDNVFMLQKSVKRLAVMSGATNLRFFGKIFGTKKDYWVVQGVLNDAEEKSTNAQAEKRGEGVNAYVYWVTDNLLSDWIQLPDATPEQLVIARMIKHVFTGNLNTEIDCCPPFPGKERHLLRCQLARITHGTEICPKGLYEIDEETNAVKLSEEFAIPGTEELKGLETWAHRHQNILLAGRCSHIAPTGMSEEQKEEYMAKIAEEDKAEERFRAIQDEGYKPVKGLESAWLSKVCGDTQ